MGIEGYRQTLTHTNGGKAECTVGEAGQAERESKKLGVRVAEFGARKEKYKAMENEGKKLPATWKFAQLEEEEKKEAARLPKLPTDVCVLEEELADVSDNDDSIEIGTSSGAGGDRNLSGVRVQS